MKSKLWVFREIDPIHREILAQALSISSATASLLVARGVTTLTKPLPGCPISLPTIRISSQTWNRQLNVCGERWSITSRSAFMGITMLMG